MIDHYGGNAIPEITKEEHDGTLNAKKVNIVGSTATIFAVVNTAAQEGNGQVTVTLNNTPILYAVVNTSAPGVQNSMTTIFPRTDYIGLMSISGNVNVGTPTVFLGNPTLFAVVNTQASSAGLVTLASSPNYIGLASVNLGGTLPPLVASSAFVGLTTSVVGNTVNTNPVGNTTLNPSSAYIGLASVNIGGTLPALSAGTAKIGLVTLNASNAFVGLVTAVNGLAWPDPKTWIGLVTADLAHAWTDPGTFIGLATTVNGAGNQFIGLVTANSLNAGTTKTLIHKNIEMSLASIATIAVATGTFKITNLVISSDATTRVSIKSGATYLTGNASLGITLFPGGGWVESGSPDSPLYIGLAANQAIVVEKSNLANIAGKFIFYQE